MDSSFTPTSSKGFEPIIHRPESKRHPPVVTHRQTIALFSSAAPIVFAVVSVLTAVLNFILCLDQRRTLPMLGNDRAKLVRTLLSYLANIDLGADQAVSRRGQG